MSTPARADINAHMEPRDAAMVTALAQAREESISQVAATLIYGTMDRRGWRALRLLEQEREDKLREAFHALDDSAIQALIPNLPRNGPRSPLRVIMAADDVATLVRMYAGTDRSMSFIARSMIEEALAHLAEPVPAPAARAAQDPQSYEAARVADAVDSIKDPQLRESFAATVERMATLCGATPDEQVDPAGATRH